MGRVFHMKRRTKGAISVFLIMIFLATYMLAGVLVDGGRYRMARALAESALDSASESVLSYYNQMLYDLYGLFAVDSSSINREQIAGILEEYVSHTLQVADIDYSGYATGLTNWLINGTWQDDSNVDYFNDYDFDVQVTAGSSVTLASTDYVEDQIVEYMKYRAPIEMLTEVDGFLEKLGEIVEIKDRLAATRDRIKITNGKKEMFKRCEQLMEDINAFNEKMIAFCNNPCISQSFRKEMVQGSGESGSYLMTGEKDAQGNYNTANAADLYLLFGKSFDDKLEEIGGYMLKEEENQEGETEAESFEDLAVRQKEAYEEAAEEFLDSLDPLFVNAGKLYKEANELRDRVEAVSEEYHSYILELQAQLDSHPDSQQYRTVYEPEIALAKSNCGELLKNMDLILSSRQFTNDLVVLGQGSDWSAFEAAVYGIITHRLKRETPITLKAALDAGPGGNWAGETACMYFVQAQGDLQALMSETSYFYKCHKMEVDVVNGEQKVSKDPETDQKEADGIKPKDLVKEDLAVAYTHAGNGGGGQSFGLTKDIDTEETENILNAGLSLVSALEGMLEGVRDNLYVNEYVMSMFSNVVMARENEKNPPNFTELQKRRYDAGQTATVAGVEYILIGGTDSGLNMLGVDAEILGIRLIFNTAAIFTDTAKVHQATTIATAISGPFAPLVTIVLLVGWATAESALDVVALKEGKEVALFKTGRDWQLSVEGAVERCVDIIKDKVIEEAGDTLSHLHTRMQDTANEAIYDIYQGASGTKTQMLGLAVSKAGSMMDDLTGEIVSNSGNNAVCNDMMTNMNHQFDTALGNVRNRLDGWGDSLLADTRDYAVKVVNESMDKAFDMAEDTLKVQANRLSNEIKESIKGKIPVGQVVNTGSSTGVKMDYEDYLRILLLMMNQQKKVERIQSLIQANMIQGGNTGFRMEDSAVAVWADMQCEIRYLFLTDIILPEGVKRQGKMSFKVYSALSY